MHALAPTASGIRPPCRSIRPEVLVVYPDHRCSKLTIATRSALQPPIGGGRGPCIPKGTLFRHWQRRRVDRSFRELPRNYYLRQNQNNRKDVWVIPIRHPEKSPANP